jgi:hypothetical protein
MLFLFCEVLTFPLLLFILIMVTLVGIFLGVTFFKNPTNPPAEPGFYFPSIIFINNYKIKGENLMTQVPFGAKSVEIEFGKPVDANGNEAQIDGAATISSTDSSIMTVHPSETQPDNPYATKTVFTGKAGAAQVVIKADAKLGEEVKEITGAETFEYPAGEAVGFGSAKVGEFEMPGQP